MKSAIAILGLTMLLSATAGALADDAASASTSKSGSGAVVAGSMPCDDAASKDCAPTPAKAGTSSGPVSRTIKKHGR
jgi:hypothetical protein